MPSCFQCGDDWPREKMLGMDLFKSAKAALNGEEYDRSGEDLLCLRCASVAMKGGPENMTEEQRQDHNVVLE